MNKGKSLPPIPPNHKLIVRKRANGDKEYIIKHVNDDYDDPSQIWGWVIFALLMIGVLLIFGSH